MIHRILFCCIMIFTVALGYGQQRQLNVEDRSGSFDVFSGGNNEAGMLIICPESIELTFASNKDQTVDVFKTEVKGSEKHYYLRLLTGKRYEGRKLTVYAPRYESLFLDAELQPKELRTIYIYDPDIILMGCYNQTMKEGLEIFRLAQYPDAKAKYRLAAECSDAPATVIDDIQEKIDIIDTIISRRRIADESFTMGDYQKAYNNYQAAFALNADDRYVEFRMGESSSRLTGRPIKSYQSSKGLEYMDEKYTKKLERRRQRTFALSYESMLNSTYGGSFGWYRNKKAGVYFSGHWRNENDMDSYLDEINASMGLTFRLFRFTRTNDGKWPFGTWLSFGGGYTRVYIEEGSRDHHGTAITPEGGALIKLGWFVMKYTYQYRPFDDEFDYFYDANFSKGNHLIGIGICF